MKYLPPPQIIEPTSIPLEILIQISYTLGPNEARHISISMGEPQGGGVISRGRGNLKGEG